jgi:hypothetical protein
MNEARVLEASTPEVEAFREAVRRLTGSAPDVSIFREPLPYPAGHLSKPRLDVGGRVFVEDTLPKNFAYALWTIALETCGAGGAAPGERGPLAALGEATRGERVRLGLSLREVAAAVGVTIVAWGEFERGEVGPGVRVVNCVVCRSVVKLAWPEGEPITSRAELGTRCEVCASGKHTHACPKCYEHKPCDERSCELEADLSEPGKPRGSHVICNDCGAGAEAPQPPKGGAS